MNTLKSHLDVIKNLRLPATRFELGEILLAPFVNDNKDGDQAKKFIAFDKKFSRPHTKPFVPLLFSLYQNPGASGEIQVNEDLLKILNSDACKGKARQSAIIHSLLSLVHSSSIDPPLKRQLMEAALPLKNMGTAKQRSVDFANSMKALQSLVLVGEQGTKLGSKVRGFLPEIDTKNKLEEKLLSLFSEVFE